jgi:hypothetical protein
MSGPAVVWLIVGLLSVAAVLAVAIALVRHVIVLGRALSRFQREVEPAASAISEEGARAGARSARLPERMPRASKRGRR